MYIPRHWHWFGPVAIAFTGTGIAYRIGPDHWFAPHAAALEIVLDLVAVGYTYYLSGAGVLHQGYATAVNTPDPKITIVEAEKRYPGLQLIDRTKMEPIMTKKEFVVEFPAFNLERYIWKTVLQMYDMDPETQKHVDLTEERWVLQKKVISQKPFANMKLKAEHFGLLKRKHKGKSAGLIVKSREAVALVAAGQELPYWTPPPPSR